MYIETELMWEVPCIDGRFSAYEGTLRQEIAIPSKLLITPNRKTKIYLRREDR